MKHSGLRPARQWDFGAEAEARPGRSGRLSGCEQAVRVLERWAYWHKHQRRKPKIPRVPGPSHGTTHHHE